jgi:mRNA-degrading endonuclease RelE of RelBE toxin-antitoxin system
MQSEPFMVSVAEPSPIQIALTPRFKRDLRELAKRYRSIRSDIQPLPLTVDSGQLTVDR